MGAIILNQLNHALRQLLSEARENGPKTDSADLADLATHLRSALFDRFREDARRLERLWSIHDMLLSLDPQTSPASICLEGLDGVEPKNVGPQEVALLIWKLGCDHLSPSAEVIRKLDRWLTEHDLRARVFGRPFVRWLLAPAIRYLREGADFLRTMIVAWPDLELEPPEVLAEWVWRVRIPPSAYLRACATLFWNAVRHPLSETTIDLSTGRVLYRH
jgi:hypothetical protein